MSSIQVGSFDDLAFGCILGGMLADSCGSRHEFSHEVLTDDQMEDCMKMPGGGPFCNTEGQVTDDSELSICVMLGLIDGENSVDAVKGKRILNLDAITQYYSDWI